MVENTNFYVQILNDFENGNTKLLDEYILKNYSNNLFKSLNDLFKNYNGDFSVVDYIVRNQYFCENVKNYIKENAVDLNELPDYCSYGIMYFIICSFCEIYNYEIIERDYEGVRGKCVDIYKEYMKEVKKYPVLSKEVNNKLALDAQKGDLKAKEKLINCNQRLVISIAMSYYLKIGKSFDLLDIIQYGNIGLMKAIKKYHVDQIAFSSYAYYWISQSITRNISIYSKIIHIPMHVQSELSTLKKFENSYFEQYGKTPSNEELANFSGLDKERVKELKNVQKDVLSLDKEIKDDGETTLEEMLVDENAINPSVETESKMTREDLEKKMSTLDEREIYVIRARFGFDDGICHTLQEIGEKLSLTRERVRQIEIKALKKLKNKTSRGYGEDYINKNDGCNKNAVYLIDSFDGKYTLEEIKLVFDKLHCTQKTILRKMYGHNLDEQYNDIYLERSDSRLLINAIQKIQKLLNETKAKDSYPKFEDESSKQIIYKDKDSTFKGIKKELVTNEG